MFDFEKLAKKQCITHFDVLVVTVAIEGQSRHCQGQDFVDLANEKYGTRFAVSLLCCLVMKCAVYFDHINAS